MKKTRQLVTVFAVACFLFTSNSFAEKVTETLSLPVYEKLQQAEEVIDTKAYDQALTMVQDMRSNLELTQYESSQAWNIEAYIYYLKEDYKQAIATYNKVLKYENLAEAVVQSTLNTVAQLHFIREEYQSAIAVVGRLIARLDHPDASLYMLQGQAHYQLKEYDKALVPIKRAIDIDTGAGKIPKENRLLLLRAIYYEKKDFKNMVSILKEVIRHYPKDSHLYSLAAVYSELGDTKKQMTLTEVLFEKGYIEGEQHALNLASLYLSHNLPYKAAQLLQREVDNKRVKANERNLRLLSQAWYQAREDEKAIPPMRLAAKQSEKGELYIRLAQSYLNLEQWSEAVKAIEQGLKKGGIKKPGTANIMLGTALFNLKELGKARKAFTTVVASKAKDNSRIAKTWLAFLDSEIRRSKLEQESAPEFERSLEAQENIEGLS